MQRAEAAVTVGLNAKHTALERPERRVWSRGNILDNDTCLEKFDNSPHFLAQVIGQLDLTNLQQGRSRQCDLCDDEDSADAASAQYCQQCNLHLCELHATAHQRSKDSKSHSFWPFSQYVANLKQVCAFIVNLNPR